MRRLPNLLFVAIILAALLLPAFAVGAAPSAAPEAADGGIQVRVPNFAFDPVADGEPKLTASQRFDGQEAGFRLVQFYGATEDAWLTGLQEAGLKVLQYYPHYTYLVWGAESALRAASTLDAVRWAGNFHPAYKINSDLVGRKGVVQNVDVMFYNNGDTKGTLDSLTALGGKVIQAYPAQPDQAFFVAVVELDAAAFDAVSRLGTVLWLGYSHPVPVLDDEMSSQIQAGNYSGAGVPFTGYNAHLGTLGVDGSGVRWATIDTGVDFDHPDFAGRIVAGYSFPGTCAGPAGTDCPGGGHGTHVTGIIGGDAAAGFADANGFLYGLGVAPNYDIVAMNSLSAAAWPPAGGWQEHSKQAVLLNAIGGNNSWTTGEGTNHGYQASERTHDLTVLDGNFDTAAIEPFIQVFSAGNSGPGANTLTAPKEGKNLIIVAASQNYRVGSINNIASFSSRGPAVDGRIVPTITTPGEQIASARNDTGGSCSTAIAGTNNLYAFCSGTSMAAPHASGAVVLATEWWRGFNAGANPSAAMAKALLVNSAVDMGTADIPNFNEGWGRVNVTKMIQPGVNTEYWDNPVVFANSGEQWTLSFGVADTSKPLKITLAWSDAPGAVGANPALVNNLNLTVDNGANSYRGNVFSGGWSATGGAADTRNNLENVYIQNPSGSASITIDAVNIAGDAVLGNGDPTDQSFSLICQNCLLAPDFSLDITPASQNICTPSNAVYNIAVGSTLGYNDPVTLSASGHPGGTTASFSVNPVTPAGASVLTIGNTGAAAPGSYSIDVVGVAVTSTHTATVGLNVFTAAPAGPTLLTPANGALNVPATPTFTWNAVAQAASYSIQVATDAGFSNIVASATGVAGTSWVSNVALNTSTTHYWRVWADNACGAGAFSATWSFTTVAAPGDCSPGTTPRVLFTDGFEAGIGGWTTPAGVGVNTWAISTAGPHSGVQHMRGTDPSAISDQRLVSPVVALPTGENPVVLKFWHKPNLENSGTTACFDGGILEVSTDGGTTWTQVPNANLLVGPYTGAISSSFSNPLAGLQAWCGATSQPYIQTIADVSAYAGQSAQFRMRIGSDSSVARTGWDVDDVMVQSCTSPTAVELSSVAAASSQSPVAPLAGLPVAAALAAGLAALGAGYTLRRRQ
jgi:subtilisin family serine protease